jgi:hypothetical protein
MLFSVPLYQASADWTGMDMLDINITAIEKHPNQIGKFFMTLIFDS